MFSQKTNSGTEFWMGFMKNFSNNNGGLRLYISASNNSKVKITIPLQSFADSIYIPKDSVKVFVIPSNLGYIKDFDSVLNSAVHIVSDFPITISAMNLAPATTDASIVLPIVNIPKNAVYVTGQPNGNARNSLIMLVASEDSTKVSITPTAGTTGGHAKGVAYFKTLNKGQLYQIASNNLDLSGSIIKVLTQTKLVVFSGHECSNWPCGACDHQVEQVLPVDVLDTSYCAPPNFGHVNGYYLKIIPIDTISTSIKANGKTYNNISRLNPLVLNVTKDSGFYVSSTKLFHCYQFLKGAGCNGYITTGYGDPSMLELVSTKFFGESSLFSTVNSTNLKDHFVSIVIKTSAKNLVYLDKTKVDSSEFKPFPYNKNFSYAGIKLSLGQHLVECSEGMLAYCYGIGNYESYLYLAGFSLPNFDLDFKDSVITYDCKNQKILKQFKAKSDKILKKYTWDFGDGTKGAGNPVQHLYNTTGVYFVKLLGEDFNGKKDSITRKINVTWPSFDPVRNKVICGFDTVTFEEKNPFFTNFKWQDSSTKNFHRVWGDEKVWVTATDTSGYCKFIDTGVVGKIDIFSNILVDSIEKCWKYNRFKFKDTTKIISDQILHKAWVFPWTTVWDVSETTAHFPMPGKYKVYFDVYTTQANCKARYPIDVIVYPRPKGIPKIKGDLLCSNTPIMFWDSSTITSGYIEQMKLTFDDSSAVTSDSLKAYKTLTYDKNNGNVVRFYNHIAISESNCSDTILNAALVWPKPLADFSITTTDTIKCLPSARWTFTSKTTVDVDSFRLFWDAGNGLKSTALSMKNIRYLNAGKYKVKLKAESPYGCHDSITKNIEVINVPKADFYSPDSVQCFESQSFKFIDSSKGQYLTYHWELGNNTSSTKKTVDSVSYTSPGTKQVKLKVSAPYAGCEDSAMHNVFVLKEPKAGLKVNKDTQCLSGNTFILQNQSTFSQSYRSTLWSSGTTTDTNFQLPSIVFSDTGTYTYQLIINDNEGCTDTAYAKLRVIAQPIASFAINDTIQCYNVNRFVFRTINSGNDTYDWKINNQIIYSGKTDSLVYNTKQPGLYTISLVNKNQGGCKDSISKTFRLLDTLKADFIVDKDSQCFVGHSFNFTDASKANNDVINQWVYDINNLTYAQSDVPGITYTGQGSKKVILRIQTKETCVDSLIKNVFIFPNPDGFITGDSICLYDEATLKVVQTAGDPLKLWDWDLGDGNTANTNLVKHQYNTLKNYDLSVNITDAHGCSKLLSMNNGVIVYPIPDPTFTFTEATFGINQARVHFQPIRINGYTYYWQFPDGSQQTTDTPTLLVKDLLKGTVNMRVTSQDGCRDSSSQDIYIFPNNFNVYIPNAITANADLLNDIFKLQGLENAIDFNLHIYNRWGEEIFFSKNAAKGWDGSYQGKPVQEGVYVYYVTFTYFDGKKYVFNGTITLLN